jgi:hypothetical protein
MGLLRDRGDRPRCSAGVMIVVMTAAMTAVIVEMTAKTTGATGGATARTAAPDPGCCGDSSEP